MGRFQRELCLPLPAPEPGTLTAVPLVLPVSTVVLPIATEDAGNTAVGVGALELTGQAHVDVWRWQENRVTNGGWQSRGRERAPRSLCGEVQAQGLEQQETSLERRLRWAELPRPGSAV